MQMRWTPLILPTTELLTANDIQNGIDWFVIADGSATSAIIEVILHEPEYCSSDGGWLDRSSEENRLALASSMEGFPGARPTFGGIPMMRRALSRLYT